MPSKLNGSGKTNFEYGVLSEHADRLAALIEK